MEIKFRGQVLESKQWVYGGLSFNKSQNRFWIHTFNDECFMQMIEVKPESVGQLWKPSLGIELYTGDLFTAICSASSFPKKEVRLCKADFGNNGLSVGVWFKKEWWGYGSMDFTSIKIVGNIIDDTDLLGW